MVVREGVTSGILPRYIYVVAMDLRFSDNTKLNKDN